MTAYNFRILGKVLKTSIQSALKMLIAIAIAEKIVGLSMFA